MPKLIVRVARKFQKIAEFFDVFCNVLDRRNQVLYVNFRLRFANSNIHLKGGRNDAGKQGKF